MSMNEQKSLGEILFEAMWPGQQHVNLRHYDAGSAAVEAEVLRRNPPANPPIKTSDRAPTAADANEVGNVLVWAGNSWACVNWSSAARFAYWKRQDPAPVDEDEAALKAAQGVMVCPFTRETGHAFTEGFKAALVYERAKKGVA